MIISFTANFGNSQQFYLKIKVQVFVYLILKWKSILFCCTFKIFNKHEEWIPLKRREHLGYQ